MSGEEQRKVSEGLSLDRVMFIGRTYEEYFAMFNLKDKDIFVRRILDCPAGACSFTAEANRRGGDVTATDMMYSLPVEQLEKKGREDLAIVMERMLPVKERYRWDFYASPEALQRERARALQICMRDMKSGAERYIYGKLPSLPFRDRSFDLTLSAHFLFLYADRLSLAFHRQSILELMRVTREEIRIFPIVDLQGQRYPHLERLREECEALGWTSEERKVAYEFQKHAHSMLVLIRKAPIN